MLQGIDPVLNGALLRALDEMGHGDAVVVADAHFTASKLARKWLVDLPGLGSPRVLAAIRSVLVPDDYEPFQMALMAGPSEDLLEVQTELITAAGFDHPRLVTDPDEYGAAPQVCLLPRQAFYDRAATAELIVRTGEVRPYGNALFFKGVTPPYHQ